MHANALAPVPTVDGGAAELKVPNVRQPEKKTKKHKKDKKRDKKPKRSVVAVVAGAAQSLSSPAITTAAVTSTVSADGVCSGAAGTPSVFEAFPVLRLHQAEHLAAMKHRHPPPRVRIRRNYPFLGVHSVRAEFFEEQQLGVRFKARAGRIVVDRLNRQFNQPGLAERQGVEVGDVVAEVNGTKLDLTGDGGSGGDDDDDDGRQGAMEVRRRVKEDFRRLKHRPLHLVLWRFEPDLVIGGGAVHAVGPHQEIESKNQPKWRQRGLQLLLLPPGPRAVGSPSSSRRASS
jgi:hypothetical protein